MRRGSITIERIEHVRGHWLHFTFSDGHQSDIDFKPWIASLPTDAEQAYLKPARFKRFSNHLGHAIMWGDFDIIFPLVALYHGNPDLIEDGEPVGDPRRTHQRKRTVIAPSAQKRGARRPAARRHKVA